MIAHILAPFLLLILLVGCSSAPHTDLSGSHWQEICGRDHVPIYHARVADKWLRKDPLPEQSIADTTLALCEFFITGLDKEQIRITVHNFPVEDAQQRIPPEAQVGRWKRQYSDLTEAIVFPQAHGGFTGLYLQAEGVLANRPTTTLGWAMQAGVDQYTALSSNPQMRAEYTIKAVGPPSLMEKHKTAIIAFASSFELIQEIPMPL